MKGGKTRKTRGKPQKNSTTNAKSPSESEDTSDGASYHAEHEAMEAVRANIIAEIQAVRSDMKKEFTDTMALLKGELADFRGEINQKLSAIFADLKAIRDRAEEMEQRVAAMEEWSAESREVLSYTLELQESIQAHLTDLEAQSRRNNIRIHSIPEEAERGDMQEFLEKFIKTHLALSDTSLDIQRCHRSLGAKPPQGSNPRSIIIYFLEYKTKELVLHSAWKKKEIHYEGRQVFFEQDYPTEIVMKRKAYSTSKKALKEKGIRFQTLYPAKLKVFYDTSPVIYNSSQEAADDLKKKGLIPDTCTSTSRRRQLPWVTAGATTRRSRDVRLQRIREKLKGFRREDDAK